MITYTRSAKCKDCKNLKYYYKGKLKRHKCIKRNINRCLEDSAGFCIDEKLFYWNPTAMPKRLEL
jgi:hypothetical protein